MLNNKVLNFAWSNIELLFFLNFSLNESINVSVSKKMTYNESFLVKNSIQLPHFIICMKTLMHKSMKLSKVRKHLAKLQPHYANK